MNQHFITQIHIDKVRHLQNITIPLSETTCKHLILTGKNGSGKTSVMEALKAYLSIYTSDSNTSDDFRRSKNLISDLQSKLVDNLCKEGLPLGGLWYSDYLDGDDS